ncbi:MAG: hypothetical protein ACHQ50_07340 [Fimbriimonadales bacterium]
MISLIAVAAFRAAPEPMLAFVARIYYPPGDRRVSHAQLFVSDFHGSHRRLLTHGRTDILRVWWIGRSALAWQTDHAEFVSLIEPLRPKRFALPKDAEVLEGTPRGTLVFYHWHHKSDSASKAYVVTPHGVAVTDLARWTHAVNKSLGFRDNSGESQCATTDGRQFGLMPDGNDFNPPWKLRLGRQEYTIFKDGPDWLDVEAVRAGTFYFRGQDVAGASHGRNDTIYAFVPNTAKLTKVVGDLARLDYRLDSPLYAGLSDGGMGVTPYGRKRVVWSSNVLAGDLRTGKRWVVLGGTVWAQDVAVQP